MVAMDRCLLLIGTVYIWDRKVADPWEISEPP